MQLLYHFSPGVLTVVLAVLAAVTSLPRVNEKLRDWRVQALAIFVFCLIAAGEVAIIQNADSINESHFQTLVSRFDNTDRLVSANTLAQQRVASLPVATATKSHAVGLPGLKERAIRLSADILAFLTQRQVDEPPIPRNRATYDSDMHAFDRYSEHTMSIYSQMFARQVISIHAELARKGISDEQFDTFYERPTNPIGVRIVAEHLGALAERLPD